MEQRGDHGARFSSGRGRRSIALATGRRFGEGQPDKRAAVYAISLEQGATPTLLHCRCDDPAEVARRFRARNGREHEPPNEASDLFVFRDIARRWTDPAGDRLPDGRTPTVISYETGTGVVGVREGAEAPCVDRVVTSLGCAWDPEGQVLKRPAILSRP